MIQRYVSILLAAVLPFTPVWQQPLPAPPTFRTSAHLVQVNVIVRDKNGRAIADLSRDDFSVIDEKQPQTISVFSVDSGEVVPPAESLPPNTFTDASKSRDGSQGGVTIILLDNLNTLSATAAQVFE